MRAQDMDYSGAMLAIPGLENGGSMDAIPMVFSTNQLNLNAAGSRQHMIPFDGKILAAIVQSEAAAAGETANMNFGTAADATAFGQYTVDENYGGGVHVLYPDDLTAVDVNAGDVVAMASGGGASTSKNCALSLVIAPTTE